MDLLRRDFALFDGLLSDEADQVVVADTSFVETAVFSARAGIEMSPAVEEWIRDPSDNGIQQNLMVGCIPPILSPSWKADGMLVGRQFLISCKTTV